MIIQTQPFISLAIADAPRNRVARHRVSGASQAPRDQWREQRPNKKICLPAKCLRGVWTWCLKFLSLFSISMNSPLADPSRFSGTKSLKDLKSKVQALISQCVRWVSSTRFHYCTALHSSRLLETALAMHEALCTHSFVRLSCENRGSVEERFPKIWTAEGLTSCTEAGYEWKINSSTWNHLQARWQASGPHPNDPCRNQPTRRPRSRRVSLTVMAPAQSLEVSTGSESLYRRIGSLCCPFLRQCRQAQSAILGRSDRAKVNPVGKP